MHVFSVLFVGRPRASVYVMLRRGHKEFIWRNLDLPAIISGTPATTTNYTVIEQLVQIIFEILFKFVSRNHQFRLRGRFRNCVGRKYWRK